MGCHGNHAFRQARISFYLQTNFWGMTGVPMNNSTPMETRPVVAR